MDETCKELLNSFSDIKRKIIDISVEIKEIDRKYKDVDDLTKDEEEKFIEYNSEWENLVEKIGIIQNKAKKKECPEDFTF